MEDIIARYKEEISLLRLLLNKEQIQREGITKQLHAKIGGLTNLKFKLHDLEIDPAIGESNLKIINEQKKLIDKMYDDLKSINAAIYPPLIHVYGVIAGIKQFIRSCNEEYDVSISFDTDIVEKMELSQSKEIGIYKTCTEIITLMCGNDVNDLMIKINHVQDHLDFEVLGVSEKQEKTNPHVKKHLEFIKGLLVWQDVKISPETDWKDKIKISFSIS